MTRILLRLAIPVVMLFILALARNFAQDSPPQTFDVFSDVTGQAPADPSFPPPGFDIFFGPNPGGSGSGNPGPGGGLPGLLGRIIPGMTRRTSNDPCNGQGRPATDRQVFETMVYRGVCAMDGVSPGVARVCADLPAQPLGKGRSPCLVAPPRTSQIWTTVHNCNYYQLAAQSPGVAVRPVRQGPSYAPQTSCQNNVIQVTCADVLRLNDRAPYSSVYGYATSPQGVVPSYPPDMNGQYNRASFSLQVPGEMPAASSWNGEINPLIQYSLMARYCAGLKPARAPQSDCDCLDPDTMAALASVRQEMQSLQAQADSLHNDFLSGAVSALTGFVSQAAHPEGTQSREAWNAIVSYFTNDNAANHVALRKAAVAAVNAVRQRPAYYAGTIVGPAIVCHVVSGVAKTCSPSTRITREVTMTKAAGIQLKAIIEDGEEFGAPPDPGCPPGGEPNFNLNPKNRDNVCFQAAVAHDLNSKGFRTPAGNRFTVDDILPPSGGQTTPAQAIRVTLKRIYEDHGGYGNERPRNLSEGRNKIQSEGQSGIMHNKQAVVAQLRNRGVGSSELVMIKPPPGASVKVTSHVFLAENSAEHGIRFFEPLNGADASGYFDNAYKIWAFAVK